MNNIWEVENMLGLKKIESPYYVGGFYYEGVMVTGEFKGICDYNRGIVNVKIGEHKYPGVNKTKISITTIDDGVWQGFSDKTFTSDEIKNIVKEFMNKWRFVLPSESKLNEFLNKFNIHGLNTG